MSQRNISDLPRQPAKYRVDRVAKRSDGRSAFETRRSAIKEDARRAKGLRKAINRHPNVIDVTTAEPLADQLEISGESGETPDSLASSLYMRGHRVKVIGALWQLMDARNGVTTFTVIPDGWDFTPAQLASAMPILLLRALLTDLYRKGAKAAGGWLFAFIHGEFDPVAGVYRLHIHGACSPEMIEVLDRLRLLPKYKSVRQLPNGEWNPVYRRVWIRRKPLHSMPNPITYLMQAFWPSRPIYIDAEGKRRRVRQKQAIREPFHSMVLLWLNRWRLKDLTLMVGLRVTRAGLIETRPRR